ncbi:hypothetical protein V5O48_008744 [Marasmius crinis-equi]|uniref:Uncharacterized protein n=1 Tax=Marasmius crinis-equi TaxID=585013 RepID=A0ABR3FD15_9AGAR
MPAPGPLVPPDLAAIAPHFAELEQSFSLDPHISLTNTIRLRFSTNKSLLDHWVFYLCNIHMLDPLPESVWKNILLDKLVNFDKLHTALQPGYNHSDAPKVDLRDVIISSKQEVSSNKLVTTEVEWNRTFSAWSVAVGVVFPHRKQELFGYVLLMAQFFRDTRRNPTLAISLDGIIRDAYDCNLFHLDDQSKFTQFALSLTTLHGNPESGNTKSKEYPSTLVQNSAKQTTSAVICLNWNRNMCREPCPAWADPLSPPISPAVINSETAPPLPDPSAHLSLDPAIQAALMAYGASHIKVKSPFNVTAFLNLLHHHPNRPLINSVEKGFRFGFWPYDDGNWKLEPNHFIDRYTSDERELSAIREYAAKELKKAHWSSEILEVLPGMVISPMFVVWQESPATMFVFATTICTILASPCVTPDFHTQGGHLSA